MKRWCAAFLFAFALAVCVAARTRTVAGDEEVAVVKTSYGQIVWRFFPEEAPGHTAYVKRLIHQGFYDGTTFHRVIPHFVVQGGDPNSRDEDRSNDGEGEGDRRLKAEFSSKLHYRPGTVGMARDADPDSGSCQFFIALTDLPRLDGRYTIFGEVIEGLDAALRIAELPRDLEDDPIEPVRVTVRLEMRPVRAGARSLEPAGASGEVVTGPGKARPYDARNVLWKPPVLLQAANQQAGGKGSVPPARLELVVGERGEVLDVRFPRLDTPKPAALKTLALDWSFQPALYAGKPQKVRFELDSDGQRVGSPTGGGAPVEATDGIEPPKPANTALRVQVPAGQPVPERRARLRLVIDAAGKVADAALQSGSGNAELDRMAVEAAGGLTFSPALRRRAAGRDPEPVAVYLDLEAIFIPAEP